MFDEIGTEVVLPPIYTLSYVAFIDLSYQPWRCDAIWCVRRHGTSRLVAAVVVSAVVGGFFLFSSHNFRFNHPVFRRFDGCASSTPHRIGL
ncbi:hypothetical protein B0T17DRAFT_513600 [Bombardia bombarda]|uniref:Uncharacterized protein n=1 Tax=Bombardia bombarda TaxID=252184 RepID=A0AA39XJQ9_9PEZI|nr:hypothetical protein B0T17DRAFT_513600 [Bombardia bombarda]